MSDLKPCPFCGGSGMTFDTCENASEITRKTNASGDLIRRKDALKWCKPYEWGTPDERWRPESEYGEYIRALPTASSWIPCSERLPEVDEYVLVTNIDANISIARKIIGYDCAWFFIEGYLSTTEEVIAWMPLPAPWKGETDEDTN